MYTLPHSSQSYETVGDWKVKRGKLREIKVSDMKNEEYAFLVAFHEQIEVMLCIKRGITQKMVDSFDKQYEKAREKGIKAPCGCRPTKTSEPGHDRHAPYKKEHCYAEMMERMLAKEMGVCWEDYNKTVNAL